jgi:hypothetical protein
MSNKITIDRGNDGFGSQLLSIFSGIAYAKKHDLEYIHTPISGIKLLDKQEMQNKELDKANAIINSIVSKMGIRFRQPNEFCISRPFFHYEIANIGYDYYYDNEFLSSVRNCYQEPKPEIFDNSHNIAVHIRRGSDIFAENDIYYRIVNSDVYDKLIEKLHEKYKNSKIHIFSWTDPKLTISYSNVVYHISDTGDTFLDHFNCLVHADVLMTGSSTFSVCAGMLNKNRVLGMKNKLVATPLLQDWLKNYEELMYV